MRSASRSAIVKVVGGKRPFLASQPPKTTFCSKTKARNVMKDSSEKTTLYISFGLVIGATVGLVIGTVVGAVTGDIANGVALGSSIGAGAGLTVGAVVSAIQERVNSNEES
jgi:hypothetical protein